MRISTVHATSIVVALTIVPMAACVEGTGQLSIGDDCDSSFCGGGGDGPAPSFTPPPDDGGDAEKPRPEPQELLCVGTECPSPYATCGAELKCSTNLSTDRQNCGACGKVCPEIAWLSMTTRCLAGQCEAVCVDANRKDCNGIIDDGCESEIDKDPRNCGGCGHACAPGDRCIAGTCGCGPGRLDCSGLCVDPTSNDRNCNTCANVCPPPPPGTPAAPPFSRRGCSGSQCGQLKCFPNRADCNHDLGSPTSDGCEVLVSSDPRNCGSCGIACAQGQTCYVGQCVCDPKEVLCLDVSGSRTCTDLQGHANHCGACGHVCQAPSGQAHAFAACKQGACAVECEDGWGDCDRDPSNGCEANLRIEPGHCGACGTRCDVLGGQPCVEGECLQVACDGGTTR